MASEANYESKQNAPYSTQQIAAAILAANRAEMPYATTAREITFKINQVVSGPIVETIVRAALASLAVTPAASAPAVGEEEKLVAELRKQGAARSAFSKQMSDDKTERNRRAGEPESCYDYVRPEQTLEWEAADALERLTRERDEWKRAADGLEATLRQATEGIRALRAQLSEARDSAIEECVRWHDKSARECAAISAANPNNELGPDCATHAADHRLAAAALRSLKSQPATVHTEQSDAEREGA
jgi:hypothetical protein